jgi:hypothetical protein
MQDIDEPEEIGGEALPVRLNVLLDSVTAGFGQAK